MKGATIIANFNATKVAAPTFSLAPGSYTGLQTITLSTTTQNATIHYTLDGTTPSESVGITYSGAFSINSSVAVKAMAFLNGVDSSVVSATYTIAPSDFTITVYDSMMNLVTASSPMNVVRPTGNPVTYNFIVKVSPLNGFSGTVSFNLFSGLPANTTTIGIPQGITVTGSGPAEAYLPIIATSNAALGPATITFNAFSTVNNVSIGHANTPAYLYVNSGPPPALSASCMVSPNPTVGSVPVNFIAMASGGTPPYKYAWSETVTGTTTGVSFIPPTSSTTVTYPEHVVATDSTTPTHQTASADCNLTVNALTPASMVGPTPGSLLTGWATVTFSWSSASGASQYKVLLGSTAGASDFGSANAGSALSVPILLPSGNPPVTMWATVGTSFGGQWFYRYYAYQVAANPSLAAPSAIVNAPPPVGSDSPHFVSASCDSSQTYTICDDGSQLTLYYQITSTYPSGINSTGITCQWDDSLLLIDNTQAPLSGGAQNAFSLTVHADPGVRTGGHGLTCQLPSLPACSGLQTTGCLQGGADALTVYDATPVITDVAPDAAAYGVQPALVSQGGQITISGNDFGPSGTLELCDLSGNNCVGIPTLTWGYSQITALINAPPGSRNTVRVVAKGWQGTRFLASASVTSDTSDPWEVDVAAGVTITSVVASAGGQARGGVGGTADVVINGENFGSTPTVNVSGISVQIVSVTNGTVIHAIFTIPPKQAGGSTAITVTAGSQTSAPPNKDFFVQIPTTLVRETYPGDPPAGAPNGYGPLITLDGSAANGTIINATGQQVAGSPLNQCGVERNLAYLVLDQQTPAQVIQNVKDVVVTETFSNFSGTGTIPPEQQVGADLVNCPGGIASNQCVADVLDTVSLSHTAPQCLATGENQTFTQAFKATIGFNGPQSTDYPLTIQNKIAMGNFGGTLKADVTITQQ